MVRGEESAENAILHVHGNKLVEIAMYVGDDGDPEYPPFLALSTCSNKQSATGYNRECESYKPNKTLTDFDSGAGFILLLLDSGRDALDRFKSELDEALSLNSRSASILLRDVQAPSRACEVDLRQRYLRALRLEATSSNLSKGSQRQKQQAMLQCVGSHQQDQEKGGGVIAVGSDDDEASGSSSRTKKSKSQNKKATTPKQRKHDDDSSDDDFIEDDMDGNSGYSTKDSAKSKRGTSGGEDAPQNTQRNIDKKRRAAVAVVPAPAAAAAAAAAYGSENPWCTRGDSGGAQQQASRSSKRIAGRQSSGSVPTVLEDTESDFEDQHQRYAHSSPAAAAAAEADETRERESVPPWASGINSLPDDDPRLAQVPRNGICPAVDDGGSERYNF